MTDTTDLTGIAHVTPSKPASMPLPAPVPFGLPVLVSDCVTPLAGETLLGLLWKRIDSDDTARE